LYAANWAAILGSGQTNAATERANAAASLFLYAAPPQKETLRVVVEVVVEVVEALMSGFARRKRKRLSLDFARLKRNWCI